MNFLSLCGWGNLGGGATHNAIRIQSHVKIAAKSFTAWRIAFFIPALFQTVSAFAMMILGQDMSDGNYQQLHKSVFLRQV
ncbi:high affinity nitrate transporter 2.5-like [Silene latifolia]|uniref:high affinity nitrate transporter 2.5-like n=1 Tax=Silene latifolia TaxID=37657 RepID=UPI003D7785C9